MVLASEKAVKDHSLTPLARLVSYGVAGVEPSIMGIGPVPAIKFALEKADKTLDDMQLVEVGVAFSLHFPMNGLPVALHRKPSKEIFLHPLFI